jgi:predicted enzyme related to lactoylglutathione lyase
VQVEEVTEALKKVESLGGKTVVPPVEIPSGIFAWFSDLEGNIAGLWKPKG